MADEKMVTEREAILREREAYRRALLSAGLPMRLHQIAVECAAVYPLPKRVVPRVAVDAVGYAWRFSDGRFQWRLGQGQWYSHGEWVMLEPARVKLLAGLLANPTEEISAPEDRT